MNSPRPRRTPAPEAPRWLVLLLVLAVADGLACRAPDAPAPAMSTASEGFKLLAAGDAVPRYTVATPAGDSLRIAPGGSLTLLNLWAPWCSPCLEEFPDLERLHRTFEAEGLRIVAVDVDPDPPETIRRFAAEMGTTFPIAGDPAGQIQQQFQALALPSSYLISPDGHLLARWTGVLPDSAAATIRRHLETTRS